MARPKRFELLTPRFVVWCSIQLSYGRDSVGLETAAAGARHSYRLGRALASAGAAGAAANCLMIYKALARQRAMPRS